MLTDQVLDTNLRQVARSQTALQGEPQSRAYLFGFRFRFALSVVLGVRFLVFLHLFISDDGPTAGISNALYWLNRVETKWLVSWGSPLVNKGTDLSSPRSIVAFLIGATFVAAGVAAVWSIIDRHATRYATLERGFRAYLRLPVAIGMLLYGSGKVLPVQFQFFRPSNLIRPVGGYSPQGLLWMFMAFSPSYTIFAGLVEFVSGLLLLFRRGVLIGALLAAAALSNVIAIDLGYAVDSSALQVAVLLLLFDLAILAPYVSDLTAFLTFRGWTRWADSPTGRAAAWLQPAKVVVLVAFVAALFHTGVVRRRAYFGAGHAVYGVYDVVEFAEANAHANAHSVVPWSRVGNDGEAAVFIQTADGNLRRYALEDDTLARHWKVIQGQRAPFAELNYTPHGANVVLLRGVIEGDSVSLRLVRVADSTFRILRSR